MKSKNTGLLWSEYYPCLLVFSQYQTQNMKQGTASISYSILSTNKFFDLTTNNNEYMQ